MTAPKDDLKALWRDQQTEMQPMSLELIHARGFQSGIKRRNLIEDVASVIVVAAFSWYVFALPSPVLKLASVLVIAGVLVVVRQLHRRGSALPLPPGASAADSLAFHRAQLVRQRDAVRTVWLWYLAPLVPGMALFQLGIILGPPKAPLAAALISVALTLAAFALVLILNRRAARRLQRAIDDLDSIGRE
ncbi:MAG: hypothetical protein ABI655_01635 [Phenylobacterium sp.]